MPDKKWYRFFDVCSNLNRSGVVGEDSNTYRFIPFFYLIIYRFNGTMIEIFYCLEF